MGGQDFRGDRVIPNSFEMQTLPCTGHVQELTKKVEEMEKASEEAQTVNGKRKNSFSQKL